MRLPATYVDITDAPGGEKFPDLNTWPNAGGNVYGIGGSFVFRLYLADGTDHLLAVAVRGGRRSRSHGSKGVDLGCHQPLTARPL